MAPARAPAVLPSITTAAARPVSLATAPGATPSEAAGAAAHEAWPVAPRELDLIDELPQVDAHAAEIELPPPEQPVDSLDIGPVSTQLDDLDISDFDFSAQDDEADAPPSATSAPPATLMRAAADELPDDDEVDERDDTDPNYRAAQVDTADAPPALPLIVARNDEPLLNLDHTDDDDHTGPRPEDDVPSVLREDLAALESAPRASPWRGALWALFGLLLAAFAALQVAFIEREPLLAKVPQAALLVDALCARLPCLERREHGTSVRLLARDVREHPNYRDALLVNATIVNDAKTPSPYPVIDLRLRDAAGNVLSARQFQPGEYLDQSINIAEGMPSGRPVYIVLELAGKASNAVSFEFTFL